MEGDDIFPGNTSRPPSAVASSLHRRPASSSSTSSASSGAAASRPSSGAPSPGASRPSSSSHARSHVKTGTVPRVLSEQEQTLRALQATAADGLEGLSPRQQQLIQQEMLSLQTQLKRLQSQLVPHGHVVRGAPVISPPAGPGGRLAADPYASFGPMGRVPRAGSPTRAKSAPRQRPAPSPSASVGRRPDSAHSRTSIVYGQVGGPDGHGLQVVTPKSKRAATPPWKFVMPAERTPNPSMQLLPPQVTAALLNSSRGRDAVGSPPMQTSRSTKSMASTKSRKTLAGSKSTPSLSSFSTYDNCLNCTFEPVIPRKSMEMDNGLTFQERVAKQLEKAKEERLAPPTAGVQAVHCTFEPQLDWDNEFMKKLPTGKPFVERCYDFAKRMEDEFAAKLAESQKKRCPFAPFVIDDTPVVRGRESPKRRPPPTPGPVSEFLARVRDDISDRQSKRASWSGESLHVECTFEPKLDAKAAKLKREGNFVSRMMALASEQEEKLQARRDAQLEQLIQMAKYRANPFVKKK